MSTNAWCYLHNGRPGSAGTSCVCGRGWGHVEPVAAQPRKATDEEIRAWVDRHGLGISSITDARCAFEDAESQHLTRGVTEACHQTKSHQVLPNPGNAND